MAIKIIHIEDFYDCETCGRSWASGYTIQFEDGHVIDKVPEAHCFGGTDYSSDSPYHDIFKYLNIEVEEENRFVE